MDDAACVKVNDDGLIDMPLVCCELVYSYTPHIPYVRAGIPGFQVFLVYILNHVPTYTKVSRYIFYGIAHPKQVQYITRKPVCVTYLAMGKRYL